MAVCVRISKARGTETLRCQDLAPSESNTPRLRALAPPRELIQKFVRWFE